jgi:hypothetical protein
LVAIATDHKSSDLDCTCIFLHGTLGESSKIRIMAMECVAGDAMGMGLWNGNYLDEKMRNPVHLGYLETILDHLENQFQRCEE